MLESLLCSIDYVAQMRLLYLLLLGRHETARKARPYSFIFVYHRFIGMASIGGLRFKLIDTGGFDDRGHVANDVQKQIYKSLIDADVLVFMVDGKNGVNSIDVDFANWIRKVVGELEMKHKRPSGVKREIILISNKTEGGFLCDKVLTAFSEGTELGWGAPILLSAAHGEGMGELAQSLIKCAQLRGYDTIHEVDIQKSSTPPLLALRTIQLAFMGSPNVGKSSLLNAILNDERVLSGPIPGLTRYMQRI